MKQLLILVVFLLPLVSSINSFGYEQSKVIFFILTTTILGLWLLKTKLQFNLVTQVALGFVTVLLLSSLWGINLLNSFVGTEPYFQGWLLYAYLFVFFLIIQFSDIKLKNY